MGHRQNRSRILAALLSISRVAAVAVPCKAGAEALSPEELQQKIDRYESQLRDKQNNLDKKEEYQKTLDAQIETMNEKIDADQTAIDALNDEISDKETEIAQLETQMNQKQSEIDAKGAELEQKEAEKQETSRLLKERMRASYMSGQTTTLEMLLSADSFGNFLSVYEYAQRVASHDRNLVDTLVTQMEEIDEVRADLDRSKQELLQKKEAQQASVELTKKKRAELTAALNSQQETVDLVKEKLEQNNRDISEISQQYAQSQKELEQLRQAQEEFDRKAEEHQNQVNNGGGDGSDVSSSGFLWPLPGHTHLSTYFGQNGHTGIDIPAPEGTSIVATKSGRVEAWPNGRGGSYWSYGNYLIIYHDDGSTSLYAHCSSVDVPNGSYVTQGQHIAQVGHTGRVFGNPGNHLHFELRVGRLVNPLDYLSR